MKISFTSSVRNEVSCPMILIYAPGCPSRYFASPHPSSTKLAVSPGQSRKLDSSIFPSCPELPELPRIARIAQNCPDCPDYPLPGLSERASKEIFRQWYKPTADWGSTTSLIDNEFMKSDLSNFQSFSK